MLATPAWARGSAREVCPDAVLVPPQHSQSKSGQDPSSPKLFNHALPITPEARGPLFDVGVGFGLEVTGQARHGAEDPICSLVERASAAPDRAHRVSDGPRVGCQRKRHDGESYRRAQHLPSKASASRSHSRSLRIVGPAVSSIRHVGARLRPVKRWAKLTRNVTKSHMVVPAATSDPPRATLYIFDTSFDPSK